MSKIFVSRAIAAAMLAISTLALFAAPAEACNTTFLTDKLGQIAFPFCPPNVANSTPALLDNTTIGATTPAPGTFAPLHVDNGTKTATATAGAATLNKNAGVITSEALTTAAGATYTLTLTDSTIAAADQVMASVQYGSSTTGTPAIAMVTPAAGSVVIIVQNIHASAALNGTLKISFVRFAN